MSEVLTVSEAARLLGVSAQTVRVWATKGTLPMTRTENAVRIFQRVDVERLASERSLRDGNQAA